MLLQKYTLEIFRPECNSRFSSLHCYIHLEEDIGEVLPYLNGVWGGFSFIRSPPSVMFKVHGRLIALHARKIAINALQDKEEAHKIAAWLQREINETWENRHSLVPEFGVAEKPQPIEVLRLLPKSNCRECGLPTCLVFATRSVLGAIEVDSCTQLGGDEKTALVDYLRKFNLNKM